jgi:eukaryotic-like serine/threonine-protein kinase
MGRGLYQVRFVLGQGATATVCVASRQGDLAHMVALKVLREEATSDEGVRGRTADEASMLRQLSHPNILHAHRLLHYGGRMVLEMEHVHGADLTAVITKRKRGLPVGVAVVCAAKVALALEAAYQSPYGPDGSPMGVVHRDVKPSNVLMSSSGEVKLADFGLATSRLAAYTRTGSLHGTLGYAPPEGFSGADSPTTDVYSLGLTFFELLTGKTLLLPHRDPKRHAKKLVSALEHLRLKIPAEVRHEITRMLREMAAYEPDNRIRMDELILALHQLEHHPRLDVDIAAFARKHVRPIADARTIRPAAEDPLWPALSFLEDELPDADQMRSGAEVEAELDERMGVEGWHLDLGEIRRLLEQSEDWIEVPFLQVLARGAAPKWKLWVRRPATEEVEAALILLSVRPSAQAVAVAEAFVGDDRPARRGAVAGQRR